MEWSFIDFGIKDFLRDRNGSTLIIEADNQEQAEEWLLNEGEDYGWTNEGVRYWCWDEEVD